MNKEQMQTEFAKLRGQNQDMTVGERYTNEGQERLDRQWESLRILAELENMHPSDYIYFFDKGLLR
jgi:hypothetical protein